MSILFNSTLYLGKNVVVTDDGLEVSVNPTNGNHLITKDFMEEAIDNLDTSLNNVITNLDTSLNNVIDNLDTKPNVINNVRFIPYAQHTIGFTPLPENRNGDADDGWYYKKTNNDASLNKVHVYAVSNFSSAKVPKFEMKVSDLKLVYAKVDIFHTSNDDPFLTIYTKYKDSSSATGWYHSKATYMLPQNTAISVNNPHYLLKIAMQGYDNTVSMPGTNELVLVKNDTSSQGTMDDNDDILAIAFGTNSTAPINGVEIVLSQIGVVAKHENSRAQHVLYNYSNDSVLLHKVANSPA